MPESPAARSRSWDMRIPTLIGLLALLAHPAPAQTAPPCSLPEHRQFDFWIGDWEVYDSSGTRLGENLVTSELGGCALMEHWQASRGASRGNSYNIYDRRTGRWHQTWVDNGGLLLLLDGGLQGAAMVLQGQIRDPTGAIVEQRISWSPAPDGVVRQHWEQSKDGGASWTTVFDGYYRRRAANAP